MGKISEQLFLKSLICPTCGIPLVKKDSFLFCSSCRTKYLREKGIPILLPYNFQDNNDFLFKKKQINFFDKWCSIKKKKKSTLTAFEKFFSTEVGNKKINYSEIEMRQMINSLPKNPWVLELGCGAGEHSEFIAKLREDINLVMIDISLKSILETKKRLGKTKLKGNYYYLVADAEKLPFRANSFSGIIAVMFFHHVFSLDRCFPQIKRTLKPAGVCLFVDLLYDNPLIVFSRRIFHRLPSWVKQRFIDNYMLKNGEIPDVKIHRIKEIRKAVEKESLRIIKEEPYDLFLFIFGTLGTVFPDARKLLSEKVLNFLYNLEKKMLKRRVFNNYAGARTIWLSR